LIIQSCRSWWIGVRSLNWTEKCEKALSMSHMV
jgi:hypothetical protein